MSTAAAVPEASDDSGGPADAGTGLSLRGLSKEFKLGRRSVPALAGVDLDTAEGRVHALRAAAPVVARIKDPALRPEYARRLAGWLGMVRPPRGKGKLGFVRWFVATPFSRRPLGGG